MFSGRRRLLAAATPIQIHRRPSTLSLNRPTTSLNHPVSSKLSQGYADHRSMLQHCGYGPPGGSPLPKTRNNDKTLQRRV